ncbi:DUF3108 domain-containing protein [Marinomonas algicola]|jgi:hypothetical protein|uniref:DUF3108 domain-containing protein n=1 Tax=Marinomonas algicola TaxID=2773454 RepID=UPI0017488B08|nr:DUF3108 domain-containing protein [Marinomonas algicola]
MRTALILLVSILGLFSQPAISSSGTAQKTSNLFFPYKAIYSTTWKKGISFEVEGMQVLTKKEDHWFFEFTASTFFASIKENVSFNLIDNQIRPEKYYYKSQLLGKKREAKLSFDWENMKVENDIENKPWKMDIHEKTIDKLGIQLQLRQDLKANRDELHYEIADGGRLKYWTFARIGTQKIKTRLGDLDTVKVVRTDSQNNDRESVFYFAPEYDFLLVKMKYVEKKESYLLEIKSIE